MMIKSNNFYDMHTYLKIPTYFLPNFTPIGNSIAKFRATKNAWTDFREGDVPTFNKGPGKFFLYMLSGALYFYLLFVNVVAILSGSKCSYAQYWPVSKLWQYELKKKIIKKKIEKKNLKFKIGPVFYYKLLQGWLAKPLEVIDLSVL